MHISQSHHNFALVPTYSHLSNKRGGWNKPGGGAKNAKSLNVEGVINIIFRAQNDREKNLH